MTLAELQRCIADREAEGVEFKPALLSRKEIAEYAVGIGNAGGGHLIMGVTNKPPRQIQPVPPPSPDEIQQIRRNVCDSAQIHIKVENLATPSGNVVIVPIPARPRGDVFHTREITQLDRRQALWIMQQLQKEGLVKLIGCRRGSRWQLAHPAIPATNL